MAQFIDVTSFSGIYTGRYDGRNARLTIGFAEAQNGFYINLDDFDRNESYDNSNNLLSFPLDLHTHVLSDITLTKDGVPGNPTITWSRLHLHTWDISFLSGVSIWNGIEFGMSFTRVS